ncbi:glyoxylase-like metal-dependent hydrolase (beta-lactamase superfamily II) [Nonomuraea thailandensis]|uniref:Glyoxylase-like metal-dependent hydrolase (Beta-lactamase superfamily II) n=1 Tax=Nonomuraea thailandensis TaxID=1188745 RepID=A0A9X2K719_9ACTN|nr:MBL fold metallo-hydrolase [Nonomuraea thailandensis]MCP2363187.1 glyoxylase-like metal-dependent hydrolase (beta-lactamase superfamily II) [Nonomuraea thailandensis]
MNEPWQEVGDRVYVRRHESYDLNTGLIVGDGHCLVLDTRSSHREARDLVEAVRTITASPWTVVNSHSHFDHCFGNAIFQPAEIWGHARCVEEIEADGEQQRAVLIERRPELREELEEVAIVPPDHTFTVAAGLDIGGRIVNLRHFGLGHSSNDVVAHVPDAGVVFAGDLVEEGAPPAFGDSYPLDWPGTLAAMLNEMPEPVIVPGHGAVVDRSYVLAQHDELALVADLAKRAHVEGLRDMITSFPYPEDVSRQAIARAFMQLDA